MADSKQCDRCKKYYLQYVNYKISDDPKKINGFLGTNNTEAGKYYSNKLYDLCEDCVEALWKWMDEPSHVEKKENIDG